MRAWKNVLVTSAWFFSLGAIMVVILWLETALSWGWSTASNWGYFLLWLFVSMGITLVSAVFAVIAGIALLVLRSRNRRS